MALRISDRSQCVMQSEIRNMSIECDKVGGVNLSQGVCDTDVPETVRREAQKAIDDGLNSYTRYDGIEELRLAIARKLQRLYGLTVDPEQEIIVTSGATGAFYCACLALLDPGDEVVIFEPYYGYHVSTLQAVGLRPAYVPLAPPTWSLRPEALERVIRPKTRGIMINTPGNPTGKVFSIDELQMIASFAQEHDLFVFTDEIYEHFVYDGRRHVCPLALPRMRERTIAISGLSKTFSVTGWRVGYAIASKEWARPIGYFSDLVYVCAPAPLQRGVARGLDLLPASFYSDMSMEYAAKRTRLCRALEAGGLPARSPEGAYYLMADISRVPGDSSKGRAMNLLAMSGVACVPGDAFFHEGGGESLGRFCYAKKDEELDEACRRLAGLGLSMRARS